MNFKTIALASVVAVSFMANSSFTFAEEPAAADASAKTEKKCTSCAKKKGKKGKKCDCAEGKCDGKCEHHKGDKKHSHEDGHEHSHGEEATKPAEAK